MKRPRFIAGAVCPACGAMDRLQVIGDGEARRRRCVSCGHEDALPAAASPSPRSRLDATKQSRADETIGTVRILPASPVPNADDDPSKADRD